jgi:hypothetical protein
MADDDGAQRNSSARRFPYRIPLIVDGEHVADVEDFDLDLILDRGDVELRTALDGRLFLRPVRR